MSTLEIRLFGRASVLQCEEPRTELSAKALELLCYLFLYRDRAHTREALADVLWPGSSFSLSRKYLRQTLWQLRATLENRPDGEQTALLILNTGWIRVNPQAAWSLDVEAFEQAYRQCRDIPGQELAELQAKTLEEAVALYRGDLAESWYHDWCIYERNRLQLAYLAVLEQLMGYCEARQLYAQGIAHGQTVLRYDPARECTHRQLMRLYYQAGDRTTALRQYDRCTAAMATQFDLRPSRETDDLHQQIRADRLEDAPRPMTAKKRVDDQPVSDPLLDLHKRLDQIQTGMSAFQGHVRRELAKISQMLSGEPETP